MNTLLRKALHAEVSLLRMPLKALDDRVVSRYTAQDSKVRQTFQSALAVVDQAAGLLADQPAHGSAEHGPTGAAVDQLATGSAPETVTEVPAPGEPMPAEEQEDVEQLTEELLEEQEEETFAGELADDDELRRVQAELQAKHLVEEMVEEQAENGPQG